MANRQILSSYTETDTASRITVTSDTITTALLDNDEEGFVYKDFTAGYFAADFEHSFQFKVTANTGNTIVYLWGMGNTNTALGDQVDAGTAKLLTVYWKGATSHLVASEGDGTNVDETEGTVALDIGSTYYIRVCRDESVGTYGTLYVYLYSSADYTSLVEVITHTLEIKTDFQYLYALSSYNGATGGMAWSGEIKKLTLEKNPYTLQNMILRIRYILNELTANFWTDAQLTGYINDGIREIAVETGCIQHIDLAVTTPSARTVSFSGHRCVGVEYIPAVGKPKYMRSILPNQVNHVRLDGASPQYWYEWGDNIGIEPIPTLAYNLRLYIYDYQVAELSANTEVPELPMQFRSALLYYVLYKALLKDRKFQPAVQMITLFKNELTYNILDKIQQVPTALDSLQVD